MTTQRCPTTATRTTLHVAPIVYCGVSGSFALVAAMETPRLIINDRNNRHDVVGRIKFCGRVEELNILHHAYERASIESNPVACSVFIEGDSGSGKSALIRAFRDALLIHNSSSSNESSSLLFCRGKFEEGGATVGPFTTVVDICESMMRQLLQDEVSHSVWRNRLDEELSEQDRSIVQNTIPSLENFFPDLGTGLIIGTHDAWSFDRLRFALRSLIRTVSHYIPLVLFLDDLQWAGEDALMLIQAIIIDKVPHRRMLILGAYRPVPCDHPLVTRVLNQRRKQPRSRRATHAGQNLAFDRKLSDLSESETLELISSYLGVQDKSTIHSLNAVVFRKTQGNPFFVLQFLRFLEQRKYVSRVGSGNWEWRTDDVYAKAEIANDVLCVVQDKVHSMPSLHQNILVSAACLGVLRLNVDILVLVLDLHGEIVTSSCNDRQEQHSSIVYESQNRTIDKDELMRSLNAIASSGVITYTAGEFKFGHDRMREGCYTLTSKDSRQAMHLAIGRRLLQALRLDPADILQINGDDNNRWFADNVNEDILVHSVNQMNLGLALITDVDERRMLSRLNYAMSKISKARSGFFPAADFLNKAIVAIAGDSDRTKAWGSDYDLLLMLSIDKARIDYCCGFWSSGIAYADTVIANAHSIAEKIPAYHTKVLCLVQDGKAIQSDEVALSVLAQLGVKYPRKNMGLHVVHEFLKMRTMIRGKSDEYLLNLPETKDPNANLTCEFFRHLIESAYMSVKPNLALLLLTILYVLQMSLTGGRFNLTGLGFIQFGTLLTYKQRYSKAFRFGNIGLQIVEKDGHYAASAKNIYHAFIAHWRLPLHDSLEVISALIRRSSYSEATRYSCYMMVSFYAGRPLDILANDILRNAEALEDYQDFVAYDHTAPLFQMASILSGDTPNQVRLTGQYMDEVEVLESLRSRGTITRTYFCKFFLTCFFSDLPSAEELLRKMSWLKRMIRSPDVERPYWCFLIGMLAFLLARTNKYCSPGGQYEKRGRAALREIRMWHSCGMLTWPVMVFILHAEDLALSCRPGAPGAKVEKVLNVYDEAISSLRDYSDYYFHLRGLANERAAVFSLEQNLLARASSYIREAHLCYTRWGASAKVIQLELLYPTLLEQPIKKG